MEINSYITGFVDGEGCFSVSFSRRKKFKLGIEVRPSFSVSQNLRSKNIILYLKKFFGCGSIRFCRKDNTYKYEVRSIDDLTNIIIPHFKKYPLKTSKRSDFTNFVKVCKIVKSNEHLKPRGLRKVIKLSLKVNKAGNKKYNRLNLLKSLAR